MLSKTTPISRRKCWQFVLLVISFISTVYDKQVQIESDNRHLELVTKKPIDKAPPGRQRMILCLQSYDLSIMYIPGK